MTFLEQFGLEHPIVQAGMGGGIAGARLAGAVSSAGGLGTVGILPPESFETELKAAQERAGAGRPVAANLLVPFATRGHVDACRRAATKIVVLHGGFDRNLVAQLRATGATVLQTVGSPPEAKRALDQGADGLVVQGREAGAHLVGVEPAVAALGRIRDLPGVAGDRPGTAGSRAVAGPAGRPGKPLLLAGGIADAADVSRALAAGADAVVAGTRFLLTEEAGAHADYKRRVIEADRTLETLLFGLGWPMRHRVVPNAATERWCRNDELGPAALRAIYRLTPPLSRLPLTLTLKLVGVQRAAVPMFGPAAALEGMPDRLIDVTPLYAGETALRIDRVVPAAEAVALLSGQNSAPAPESPTIRPS